MNKNIAYDTVSDAVSDLLLRGYTSSLYISGENDCLATYGSNTRLMPEDFCIDEIYRFEGATDPADETIVFAVSSRKHKIKGILVDAFGIYSDTNTSSVVNHLKSHLI